MTPSLWILLAPLGAGVLLTMRALARDRDPRHFASLALLGLLAARHFVSPPAALPGLDAALEAQATPLLIDLAINLGAWLVASTTSHSIHERNRAEQLQWSSMEALRSLADRVHSAATLQRPDASALDEAQALLEFGCEHLQFETGLLLQSSASGVEILVSQVPQDVDGLEPGASPSLADSLAARCFESAEVVAVDRASQGPQQTLPEHSPFAWESLTGLRILEANGAALSLVFADRAPRSSRLGSVEKSLVTLMGHWLDARAEAEAARAHLAAAPPMAAATPTAPIEESAAAPAPCVATANEPAEAGAVAPSLERHDAVKPLTPTRDAPAPRATTGFDLNRGLRELETKLRSAAGGALALELAFANPAPRIDFGRGALERVATSLLLHAADTVADGGRIEISTGNIEAPEPGTPGFGTVVIKARGPALDADQLAALYEGRDEGDAASAQRRLPLPRVVRLLRDAGGDLSLESEEGVGTTLTAFLPAHSAAARVEPATTGHASPQPA